MEIDRVAAAVRATTPGSGYARHLNAAGAALPSAAVLESVIGHLRLEARIGGYEAAEAARPRTELAYELTGRLIGGRAEDVALTESATVSWQRAIEALRLGRGDRVVVTSSTYVSSALNLFELRRRHGIVIDVVGTDSTGAVDLDALRTALRTPAALVTAAHVPTSSGLVEPVAAIGELARAAGVPYLLDATQSLGQLPTDVTEIRCAILVGTGRKFLRAPRGTGLLWVDPALGLRPLAPDVRGANWTTDDGYRLLPGARRFETWEHAHALRLGFVTALEELHATGIDEVHRHITDLGTRMRAALADVPGVLVVDPPAAGGGIVTFVREGEDASETARTLRAAGLHVVSVPASHGQWDLGRRGLPAVVRASVHLYNGSDDITALVEALAQEKIMKPRTDAKGTVQSAERLVVDGESTVQAVGRLVANDKGTVQSAERLVVDGEGTVQAAGRLVADGEGAVQAVERLVVDGEGAVQSAELLVTDGEGTVQAAEGLVVDGEGAVQAAELLVADGESTVQAAGRLVVDGEGAVQAAEGLVVDGEGVVQAVGRLVAAPALVSGQVDVVVIGAGVHGSSAAWQLAARGDRVLHLEQFAAGHGQGSSHGPTRMIRRAYPSSVWDGLVDRAYSAWAEVEAESGRTLVTRTGGLYARPVGDPTGLRGPGCTLVDGARAAEIFPGLALGDEFVAVHDPAAGVIDSAAALETLADLGRRHGVVRHEGTPVLDWAVDGDGVVVHTPKGSVRAGRLVVCAGPWIGKLIPEFADVLRVIRIVNIHVGASDPSKLAPPSLGSFSVEVPGTGLLYGIPAFGGRAVKVGLDLGPDDDPTLPPAPVSAEERATLRALAARFLPAADGDIVEDLACRYTMAPGNRFAVGPLPDHPQVLVAAACSGHGFKFGPALGKALADLSHHTPRPDLTFLSPTHLL